MLGNRLLQASPIDQSWLKVTEIGLGFGAEWRWVLLVQHRRVPDPYLRPTPFLPSNLEDHGGHQRIRAFNLNHRNFKLATLQGYPTCDP